MPAAYDNAIVDFATFRYIGTRLVKLAVVNGMRVLNNLFRVTAEPW